MRERRGRPKLSVALGTHNGERFIAEQIASILGQTTPPDEIVLSDDASSDRTVHLVQAAIDAHRERNGDGPELLVLRNEPALGVTKNFEQAISRCTGDLIALCDQDDVWHPERLERLTMNFADPSVLLVFSNARQVDEHGDFLGHDLFEALAMSREERALVEGGEAFRQFMRRNLATGATVLFRRELGELAMPFPDAWLHDEWLAVVAAALDGVRLHDEALTDYRQHGSNQVGMRKMNVNRKFAMFRQPRTERNRRLYLRARALAPRLESLEGVSESYRQMAREKLAFEEARQAYPESRLRRVGPILRQLRAGRYGVYGTGLKDAVRNLLQPV